MTVYSFSATLMNGDEKSLSDYKGNVLLIVNTASRCGFSKQLNALQALFETFHDDGFYVLGFPCNQFQNQEPGTNEQTAETCRLDFGVTFPLFQKIRVKGEHIHPLFHYLTEQKKGIVTSTIKWNFTKFLINQEGEVVRRYAPMTTPKNIASDVRRLLNSDKKTHLI